MTRTPPRAPAVWSGGRHHVLALGATAAALLSRWLLDDALGTSAPFVLTFSVLLPLALVVRPAALAPAALAGWVGSWLLFVPPRGSLRLETQTNTAMVALFGLAVVVVVGAAHVATAVRTSRRRAERAFRESHEALREREGRYRTLFESNPHPMWVYDLETLRFLAVNDAAVAHYGFSRDEFLSMTLADIRPAEEVALLVTEAHASEPSMRRPGVRRHQKKSGEEIDVEITMHVLDFDGRQAGLVLAHDITEQRRAEAALRDREAWFRRLADAMPQMVWMADGAGRFTFFNRQWYEYTGMWADDTLGEGWVDAVHPEDRAPGVESWRSAVDFGLPYERELRYRSAGGEYRWFLTRALPLRNAEGRAEEWVGTCTDIEDQRHAAEVLREADRRKDEFLATLAHELRNPLAPIRMATGILRKSKDDASRFDRMVDTIDRQTAQLVRLIDDLLDVSRITRGRIELRRERVDLAAVLQQAVESVRPLCDSGGLDLTITVADSPLVLEGDPVRLAQVIGNLLNNACKYTGRGGRIHVTAGWEDNDAVVRVRDTGIGIAPEQLDRIFDMFAQGDGSSHQAPGGLGIGLSLARSLVQLHGGSLEAYSGGPGLGSEFVVRLPAARALRTAEAGRVERAASVLVGRRRILAVDDNKDALDTLTTLLRMQGHEVATAANGRAALETAAAWRPDVVLLDIGMPGMDGYEVARRIRREPWGRGLVLVAITGWGQQKDRERAAAAGFDAHLTKPADPAALAALLANAPAADGVRL